MTRLNFVAAPPLAMLLMLALLAAPAAAQPTAKFDLATAPVVGRLDRVTVELEVGGHLLQPSNPADRTSKTTNEAMSVRGKLEYDERRLTEARSARHYRLAEATLKTGARSRQPTLPADRRLIIADQAAKRVELLAAGGPLTRDEHDLIDVIGVTLGVDALLPSKAVEEGESWAVDAGAIGRLLGLDSVELCEVAALVDDTNKQYARFQLAGAVHGVIDGAATEIEIRGVGLFGFQQQRMMQLNLAVQEDRKVGPATPGFRGIAKTRIKIKPITASPELMNKRTERIATARLAQAAPLMTNATEQGFRFEHDRQWFSASSGRRSLTMRRVDGTDLAAQAAFTVSDSRREPSLADFESRVRASVGEALQGIASSEQWTNPAGCRCMGVVALGVLQGTPVEWRYYQAAGADGSATQHQRVTLAATIEPAADQREAAAAARGMVDSLTFVEKAPVSTAKSASDAQRK